MMKTDDYNDQSVTEEKLKDGAITTRKIADGSVTKDKLDSSIRQEINDSVTASNEATEKAKEATAKADQATENAKQAAVAATAAKKAADTATQLATTATTASAQATEQAKAATTKAEESAAKANEAAQRADDSREQTEQTLGTMQGVINNITEEQTRVGAELAKKFDKESIAQESGEAEDKVMSQKVVSTKLSDLSSNVVKLNLLKSKVGLTVLNNNISITPELQPIPKGTSMQMTLDLESVTNSEVTLYVASANSEVQEHRLATGGSSKYVWDFVADFDIVRLGAVLADYQTLGLSLIHI